MDAFPSLEPEVRERLAARGIDPERSFRDFLSGMVGDRVDQVIEEAARHRPLPLPEDPAVFDSVADGEHGSEYAYRVGCRCPVCREGRHPGSTLPLTPRRCGERRNYQAGCRCDLCRAAEAAYRRERKAA